MSSPDDPRDPNPFVAFRRYADAQVASMFNSISDPFRRPLYDSTDFQKFQEELWRRFERSYDRAKTPTRTQTERDVAPLAALPQDVLPGLGREVVDPLQSSDGPFAPSEVNRRELEKQRQGVFGRLLGALGKTNNEEESLRLVGSYWRDESRREKLSVRERAEDIGRRMDRCPGVQEMYAEQERIEAIDRGMEKCPGLQEMVAEQERAEEIGRRIDKCPAVQEMYAEEEAAEELGRRFEKCPWVQEQGVKEHGERSTPYSMTWSWGPWGCEMGSRLARHEASDDKDGEADLRFEEHTFGPWTIGPIHIGPMSMSAILPKDMEGEIQKAFETSREELRARLLDAQRRLEDATPEWRVKPKSIGSGDYAPTDLMKRDGFRGHLNWRQAFEELVAAETGEPLLGGTPWGSTPNESDESWRARLEDRGLYHYDDEWHKRMLGIAHQDEEKPQTSQDAPHTELEFYDNMRSRQLEFEANQERPSVLSTVTSVETVQNPDGSSTTKRTLKRRFSDGRVEKEESEESTPAPTSFPTPKAIEGKSRPTMAEQLKRDKQEMGSWFWS